MSAALRARGSPAPRGARWRPGCRRRATRPERASRSAAPAQGVLAARPSSGITAAEPDGGARRSNCVIRHGGERGTDRREVDLVPEALGECVGHPLAVVAGAVEPAVDGTL